MTSFQNAFVQLIAVSALATSVLAVPASAGFVGVSRCNEAGGTSAPALYFVDGGNRSIVRLGSGGLTRSIVQNEHAAIAWAAASGLFPEDTVFGNYSSFICGLQHEDMDEAPEVAQDPEPSAIVETTYPGCESDNCAAQ